MHRLILLIVVVFYGMKGHSQEFTYTQFTNADVLPDTKIYNHVDDTNDILWRGSENVPVSDDVFEYFRHRDTNFSEKNILSVERTRVTRIYFLPSLNHLISAESRMVDKNKISIIELENSFKIASCIRTSIETEGARSNRKNV